jgi:hypothetical protein
MAEQIKRLDEFIKAAYKEMDTDFPRYVGMHKLHLGERIVDVKEDRIDEDEYIAKWTSA